MTAVKKIPRRKKYFYALTQCTVDGEEMSRYTIYGIKITDCGGHTQLHIKDISTNKDFAEKFISLCNRYCVSPKHVRDILEDYLP
jgi:hypothetical protein